MDCYFQQDGVTCQTTHETMEMLEDLFFSPKIISSHVFENQEQ
jgi:hypothetical protein